MNIVANFEDRASSSRGRSTKVTPRLPYATGSGRTRDNSPEALPTDHDYAVPTREYQTDQSSLKTAPTAARPVFEKQRQLQKQHGSPSVDTVPTRISEDSLCLSMILTATLPQMPTTQSATLLACACSCARAQSGVPQPRGAASMSPIRRWPSDHRQFRLLAASPAQSSSPFHCIIRTASGVRFSRTTTSRSWRRAPHTTSAAVACRYKRRPEVETDSSLSSTLPSRKDSILRRSGKIPGLAFKDVRLSLRPRLQQRRPSTRICRTPRRAPPSSTSPPSRRRSSRRSLRLPY